MDQQKYKGYERERDYHLDNHLFVELTGQLLANSNTVIETDEGLKLKIDYGSDQESKVTYHPLAGAPIEGEVLSGSDWTLVRSDGVLIFDSRLTLRFGKDLDAEENKKKTPADFYLLDCTLSGMSDLRQVLNVEPDASDEVIFDAVVRGDYTGLKWPIALKARFEGSAGPNEREDASWLPDQLRGAAAMFPRFRPIVRQELFAYGTVEVAKKPYLPATKISLSMWGSNS